VAETKPTRLGELLTEAKILRKEELAEAITIATETGQMIGKVLVMSGFLSRHNLQVAIDAQSMIRDRLLEYDEAIEAMKAAVNKQVTLQESLTATGWTPKAEHESAKLGEILLGGGLITEQQLTAGLNLASESGQPLGSCLTALRSINARLLLLALDLQAAIRDGQKTKAEAIAQLRSEEKEKSVS
jgi:hypothetical protein